MDFSLPPREREFERGLILYSYVFGRISGEISLFL